MGPVPANAVLKSGGCSCLTPALQWVSKQRTCRKWLSGDAGEKGHVEAWTLASQGLPGEVLGCAGSQFCPELASLRS